MGRRETENGLRKRAFNNNKYILALHPVGGTTEQITIGFDSQRIISLSFILKSKAFSGGKWGEQ